MFRVFSYFVLNALLAGCVTTSNQLTPDQKLLNIADDYYQEYILRYPNMATLMSVSSANDKLPDNTLSSLKVWHEKEDLFYTRIMNLKSDLSQIENISTFGLVEQALASSIARRVCKSELWQISDWDFWVDRIAYLSSRQPISTENERAVALMRFTGLDQYMRVEVENLRVGLKMGLSSPKYVVEILINELDKYYLSPDENSNRVFKLARNSDNEVFKMKWKVLARSEFLPAIKIYRDFLANEYLQKARDTLGLSELPNNAGNSCYLAHIKTA